MPTHLSMTHLLIQELKKWQNNQDSNKNCSQVLEIPTLGINTKPTTVHLLNLAGITTKITFGGNYQPWSKNFIHSNFDSQKQVVIWEKWTYCLGTIVSLIVASGVVEELHHTTTISIPEQVSKPGWWIWSRVLRYWGLRFQNAKDFPITITYSNDWADDTLALCDWWTHRIFSIQMYQSSVNVYIFNLNLALRIRSG